MDPSRSTMYTRSQARRDSERRTRSRTVSGSKTPVSRKSSGQDMGICMNVFNENSEADNMVFSKLTVKPRKKSAIQPLTSSHRVYLEGVSGQGSSRCRPRTKNRARHRSAQESSQRTTPQRSPRRSQVSKSASRAQNRRTELNEAMRNAALRYQNGEPKKILEYMYLADETFKFSKRKLCIQNYEYIFLITGGKRKSLVAKDPDGCNCPRHKFNEHYTSNDDETVHEEMIGQFMIFNKMVRKARENNKKFLIYTNSQMRNHAYLHVAQYFMVYFDMPIYDVQEHVQKFMPTFEYSERSEEAMRILEDRLQKNPSIRKRAYVFSVRSDDDDTAGASCFC